MDSEHAPPKYVEVPDPGEGDIVATYQSTADFITVRQNQRMRWFHFTDDAVQSTLLLAHPTYIGFKNLQATMLWQLFKPQVNSFLIYGLGGGALARYLAAQYPTSEIIALDNNPVIIKVCKKHFPVPAHVQIKLANAKTYHRANKKRVDVLFLDIATHRGNPDWFRSSKFIKHCAKLLTDNGILAMNLLPMNNEEIYQAFHALAHVFNKPPLLIPITGYMNVVLIAWKQAPAPLDKVQFEHALTHLEMQHIYLKDCLNQIIKLNCHGYYITSD